MEQKLPNEDMMCPLCQTQYDEGQNTPRLIPSCGHTFCEYCLKKMIDELPDDELTLSCPQECKEKSKIPQQSLVNFPKNIQLLQMIAKFKMPSSDSYEDHRTTGLFTNQDNSDQQSVFNQEEQLLIFSPSHSDTIQFQGDITQRDRSNSNQKSPSVKNSSSNYEEQKKQKSHHRCAIHNRKFQIVCINCSIRICTNCALFGQHKNHQFQSEEDVFSILTAKAESAFELLQRLQAQKAILGENIMAQRIEERIKQQKNQLSKRIQQKFTYFIDIIREKEKQTFQKLNQTLSNMEVQLKTQSLLPQQIDQQCTAWQLNTQRAISKLTDDTDDQNIDLSFLANNGSENLVAKGEMLVRDVEGFRDSVMKSIEFKIQSLQVEFADSSMFSSSLENICLLRFSSNESISLPTPQFISSSQSQNVNNNGASLYNNSTSPIIPPGNQYNYYNQPTTTPMNLNQAVFTNSNNINSGNNSGNNNNNNINSHQPPQMNNFYNLNAIPQSNSGYSGINNNPSNNFMVNSTIMPPTRGSPVKALVPSVINNKQHPANYIDDMDLLNSSEISGIMGNENGENDFFQLNGTSNPNSNNITINQVIEDLALTKPVTVISAQPLMNALDSSIATRFNISNTDSLTSAQKSNLRNLATSPMMKSKTNTGQPELQSNPTQAILKKNDLNTLNNTLSTTNTNFQEPQSSSRTLSQQKSNVLKVSEKYEPIVEELRKGTSELIDLTGADIGDSSMIILSDYVRGNTTIQTLKLLKNQITDQGFAILLQSVALNSSIQSLNVSQNFLTDKAIDILLSQINNHPTLQSVILSQNQINQRNVKNQLADLKQVGLTISL